MKNSSLDIGACIYCGNPTPPLTREHVLPRGLGGNDAPEGFADALVLQNASCPTCQRITQKIEEICLISMMGPGRAKLGLRRKDRAAKTTTAHINWINGTTELQESPWDEVPGAIVIPSFYEAAILSGKPVLEVPPCDYKVVIVAPAHTPTLDQALSVGVSLTANSQVFAQMLAKIGLGLTVAQFGTAGFEPFVQNLILTGSNQHGMWVGGFAGTNRCEPRSTDLHTLSLNTSGGPQRNLIIAEIRLFAEFGGPTNYVVVGRWL